MGQKSTTKDGMKLHSGTSFFVDAKATLPDIHAPTTCNWSTAAVVVPVSASLRSASLKACLEPSACPMPSADINGSTHIWLLVKSRESILW